MLAAGRIHPVNGPRYQALNNFLPNHEHDELPCTKWLPSEDHADWMIENRLELFIGFRQFYQRRRRHMACALAWRPGLDHHCRRWDASQGRSALRAGNGDTSI